MNIPESALGPTLSVVQAFSAFATFTPPLHEIRRKSPSTDPEFAADVRLGEFAASVTVVGMGVAFTAISGSAYPLVASLITTTVFVALYECTLNGRPFSPIGN